MQATESFSNLRTWLSNSEAFFCFSNNFKSFSTFCADKDEKQHQEQRNRDKNPIKHWLNKLFVLLLVCKFKTIYLKHKTHWYNKSFQLWDMETNISSKWGNIYWQSHTNVPVHPRCIIKKFPLFTIFFTIYFHRKR